MSGLTPAPTQTPVDNGKQIALTWKSWFELLQTIVAGNTQSGVTAGRPVKNLMIGQQYFDTTLGYPVYLKTTSPSVWVNGAGTVV
jgi:hypothetical protein